MPLVMMMVNIHRAISYASCDIRKPMPKDTMLTENIVIPTVGMGILFAGDRLDCLPEYPVQHVTLCSLLLISPICAILHFLIAIGSRVTTTTVCT
jgi:hypothetical protein